MSKQACHLCAGYEFKFSVCDEHLKKVRAGMVPDGFVVVPKTTIAEARAAAIANIAAFVRSLSEEPGLGRWSSLEDVARMIENLATQPSAEKPQGRDDPEYWTELQAELDEMERNDPAVAKALRNYEAERGRILGAATSRVAEKPGEPKCKTCHRDADHIGGRFGPPCPDCPKCGGRP